MAGEDCVAVLADVEGIRRRIYGWRETKERRGAAMPEGLWSAAVGLAQRYGVYRMARALGVDYGALKERAERAAGRDGDGTTFAGFVEVDVGELVGPVATPERHGRVEAVVELSRPDGARMVVRLTGEAQFDVVGLAAGFWRGGP